MLQADKPDNYILATNRTETVRNFIKMAFNSIDIDIQFSGKGIDEVGRDKKTGNIIIKINPKYYRPAEVDLLIGNPSKAIKDLKWKPELKLEKLAELMVKKDIYRNQNNFVF